MKTTERNKLLCFLSLFSYCFSVHAILLPTLTVKAKKSHEIINDNKGVTFSHHALAKKGAISISDFLNKQGIVHLKQNSVNNNQTSIDIHGFGNTSSTNTLVLIDGIPFTSFTTLGPNLNSVLVENIAEIKVLTGSYGSLYGDQAVGGVINIITKKPAALSTSVKTSMGNHRQAMISTFTSNRLPSHIGYSVGGLAFHSDGFQQHNEQNNFNFNAKLDYIGNKDYVSLNILNYKSIIQYPPALTLGQNTRPNQINNEYIDTLGNFAFIKNHFYLNENWSLISSLSNGTSHSKSVLRFFSWSRQVATRLQNKLVYLQNFIIGQDSEYDYYHLTNQLQHNHVDDLINDIFARMNYPLTKKLHFILGGRFAYQHIKAIANSPIAQFDNNHVFVNEQGVTFSPISNIEFYIRRDTNYRFAKADEKVWIPTNIRNLQTQQGVDYETGMKWHNQKIKLSLAIYHLSINNEIAYDPSMTPLAPFGTVRNLPPTLRRGIDVINGYQLNSNLSTSFAFSYVKATFRQGQFKNKQVPAVSPFNFSASLNFHRHHWLWDLNETYSSSQFASNDINNSGPKLAGYFITNVYIERKFQHVDVGFRVNNLFNKRYPVYASFFQNGNISTVTYYPANGLSALLTVNYHVA